MVSNFSAAMPKPIYGITAHQSAVGASSTAQHVAGAVVIPANTILAGDRFVCNAIASFTSSGNPDISCLFRITDGTNTHTLIDLSETSAGVAAMFHASINLSCLTAGSSGKIDFAGFGLAANASVSGQSSDLTLKTDVDVTLQLVIQFDASNASNTVTVRELSARRFTNS